MTKNLILILSLFITFTFAQNKSPNQLEVDDDLRLVHAVEGLLPKRACLWLYSEESLNNPMYQESYGNEKWGPVQSLIEAGYISHSKENVKKNSGDFSYSYEQDIYHYNDKLRDDFDVITANESSYICSKSSKWSARIINTEYTNYSSYNSPPHVYVEYSTTPEDEKTLIKKLFDQYPTFAYAEKDSLYSKYKIKKGSIQAYDNLGFVVHSIHSINEHDLFFITDQGVIFNDVFFSKK